MTPPEIMTPEEILTPEDIYVRAVVNRHLSPPAACPPSLSASLRRWAGPRLESISLSGSHAKGTALRGSSDADLFLSLSPFTPGPIAALQSSLAAHFRYYFPEIRNVSVRIRYNGASIDLVPARRRPDSTRHTLWQSRHNTWLQTDIAEQIRHVRSSGLINEILALKIWGTRRALRFPSFLLELAVLHALSRSWHFPAIPENSRLFIHRIPRRPPLRPRQFQQ
jgi:hypothetical protein